MASSAHKQQQQPPNMYGVTAAPPPTPSTLSANHHSTSSATADALSRLLHRLPPALSLPSRLSRALSSTITSSPPPTIISLSDPNPLLSNTFQLGFFHLIDHDIPSQLAQSAELESLSLFKLQKSEKESYFPANWPLGYEAGEEDEDGNGDGIDESFCLDSSCSSESTELNLTSLREFTRAMEGVGLKIIEMVATAAGFDNPIGEDPTRFCSFMWVSQALHGMDGYGDNPVVSGGFYPYIVGLQYQIKQQKYSLRMDSCQHIVSPQVDSILVTLGDIAQVWSNGKLKKVRGRPFLVDENAKNSQCISMSLLVTLPIDSRVSPLIPDLSGESNEHKEDEEEGDDQVHGSSSSKKKKEVEKLMFESFSFEGYAWRLSHERLLLKDPLDKYRIFVAE